LPDSAARELLEETGIKDVSLKQVGAFGKPGRDPRGHTITVAFAAVLDHVPETLAGDDAAKAQWFALNELPRLAFDHSEIITQAAESCSVLWPNTIAQNKE
jgi:8-oxo-dGTP diphosphatase